MEGAPPPRAEAGRDGNRFPDLRTLRSVQVRTDDTRRPLAREIEVFAREEDDLHPRRRNSRHAGKNAVRRAYGGFRRITKHSSRGRRQAVFATVLRIPKKMTSFRGAAQTARGVAGAVCQRGGARGRAAHSARACPGTSPGAARSRRTAAAGASSGGRIARARR